MPTSARICNVFRVDVGIDPYDNASINRNLPFHYTCKRAKSKDCLLLQEILQNLQKMPPILQKYPCSVGFVKIAMKVRLEGLAFCCLFL